MKLIITSKNLGLWAAEYIQHAWQKKIKKPFVLGLPTGGTVEEMYAELVRLVQDKKMSFKNIITFNMDEYVGLPKGHPQSYYFYMKQHLFDKVDLPLQHIHFLDGNAANITAVCQQYEQDINAAGGVDLFIGGVGRNGHIAFNEPDSAFTSRTRLITLTESTRQANSRFFQNYIKQVPTHAITVGIGTVLEARELLFLASGISKAEAVAHLVNNPPTEKWPITALKTHPRAILLIDKEAANQLPASILHIWQEQQKQQPADFILPL